MSVRFSVNIPVYNAEKTIKKCIDSILAQNFGDFEINIVDDGSTDSSEEICRSFKDSRINYYRKENEGPLLTRVYGVGKSTGEFSLFVDSDDTVDSNYLESVNRIIEEENCDMVVCSFKVITNGQSENARLPWNEKRVFAGEDVAEFQKELMFNNGLNSMWSKTIRTELLKNDITDFAEYRNMKNGEDLLQSLSPVFNSKKIVFVPECFYNYIVNDAGITHSLRYDRCRDILTVRGIAFEWLERSGNCDGECRKRFFNYMMKLCLDCVKETAKSDADMETKITLLEFISANDLYRKAALGFDKKTLSAKNRIVFGLFEKSRYRTLISVLSKLS